MKWKKIVIQDDPEWEEEHCQIMHPGMGRCMLKVYKSMAFDGYGCSITNNAGVRGSQYLTAKNIDDAKHEAIRLYGGLQAV